MDEASMVGTHQLARLLHHAEKQGTKVVLVGDPAQLPEIDAGGLFRALCARLDPIQLTENRRQTQAWEATALERLRDGQTRDALDAYLDHDRIIVAGSDELQQRLLADWMSLVHAHDLEQTLIVVRTRVEADGLNAAARQLLVDAGRLGSLQVEIVGSEFAVGDRVVCLRNDRRLGVDNGTRATITYVDPNTRSLVIRPDGRDEDVLLQSSYLENGHLAHGYAITGHKAQGLTVDHALVVGDESIDGEWGYVTMSRGRKTNRLYLTRHHEHPGHAPAPDSDPISDLTHRLQRSRAAPPLTDREVYDEVETSLRWQKLSGQLQDALRTRLEGRRLANDLSALVSRRDRLQDLLSRVEERLDQTSRGLGRVTRRDEREQLIDRRAHARKQLIEVQQQITATQRALDRLGDPEDLEALRGEHDRLQATLDAAASDLARQLRRDPPGYITDLLGTHPDHPERASRWYEAVEAIARYRTRWLVDDPDQALGQPEGDPIQQADRRTTLWALRDAIRHLHHERHPGTAHEIGHDRGLGLA